jgi:hypothetical protein
VPLLELNNNGGRPLLYSENSMVKLAQNDTTKYAEKAQVKLEYVDNCNRSTYLLNDKYRFKKYLEFAQD